MTSPENGRRSRGPVTPAGRAASRLPREAHGILSREAVLPALGERVEDLDALRAALWSDVAPEGAVEEMLCELILTAYWRLRRVLVAEGGLIVTRALNVARERGAASPAALAAFDAAQVPGPREVEKLARYQGVLERQLYRAIGQLVALRREDERGEAERATAPAE